LSDFFKSKGFKVLVAVFVLLIGMLIASFLRNGTAVTLDNTVGLIVTPVQKAVSAVGGFFSGIGDSFADRKELQKQVDSLSKENTELLGKIADYEEIKRENEQLSKLIDLQENEDERTYAFASVISRSSDPYQNTVGLDRGKLSGIRVGDPVIAEGSLLVGYVSSLGDTWCTVTTLSDLTTNVGVRLSSSREVGVTECDLSLAENGKIAVAYLPKSSAAARGELVLTSGLSGQYPAGLIVGTVDSLSLASDGLSARATVTPSCDLSTLSEVFVITSFAGQGERIGE